MLSLIFTLILSINIHAATNASFEITCPKTAEYYALNAGKTLTGMNDLIGTLKEIRSTSDELIINVIDLANSSNPSKIEELSKISDIRRTLSMKESRAKENYNNQVTILSSYSAKAKACWSYLTPKEKESISYYLNQFQQQKVLDNFKKCYSYMRTTNSFQNRKYDLSLKFFRKEITALSFKDQHVILQKAYSKAESEELAQCSYLTNPSERKRPLSKGEKRLLSL